MCCPNQRRKENMLPKRTMPSAPPLLRHYTYDFHTKKGSLVINPDGTCCTPHIFTQCEPSRLPTFCGPWHPPGISIGAKSTSSNSVWNRNRLGNSIACLLVSYLLASPRPSADHVHKQRTTFQGCGFTGVRFFHWQTASRDHDHADVQSPRPCSVLFPRCLIRPLQQARGFAHL